MRGTDAAVIKQAQPDGRLVALDPGQHSIFTAAVHDREDMEQHLQAASLTLSQRYRTFSWSNSRWREVSGSKEHKAKSDKWLQDASDLRANLLSTPTPKVADTQAFGIHINHRLQHALAVQLHQAVPSQAEEEKENQAPESTAGGLQLHSSKTVVAHSDAKFSSISRGLAPTPTSSLRCHLGTTCGFCEMEELHTSMLCCACHKAMVGTPIPGKLLALQKLNA